MWAFSLTRGRWSSPGQRFSDRSPLGLKTIFYCLRFETTLFVTSYDSRGYGGSIRPRLHKGGSSYSTDITYWPNHLSLVASKNYLSPRHPSSDFWACSEESLSVSHLTPKLEDQGLTFLWPLPLDLSCMGDRTRSFRPCYPDDSERKPRHTLR
jgi:hypothetical protein